MYNCIFCKIINKEIASTILFEDDNMIIIKDINPIAPLHYLLVVKQHYSSLYEQDLQQSQILGMCMNKLSLLASNLGLEDGYRVIINQGKNGGQSVDHLHLHVLGGKQLNWENL